MSTLQLSLLIVVVVVVAGVYLYNLYEERQMRRKMDAAFAQHDDVRRAGLPLTCLQQHDSTPRRYLQITRVCGQVKCAITLIDRCLSALIMNPAGVR